MLFVLPSHTISKSACEQTPNRGKLVSFQIGHVRLLSPLYKSSLRPALPSDHHHLFFSNTYQKINFDAVCFSLPESAKYLHQNIAFLNMCLALSLLSIKIQEYISKQVWTIPCFSLSGSAKFCVKIETKIRNVWRRLFFLLKVLGIYVEKFVDSTHVCLFLDLPNLCIKTRRLQCNVWCRLFFLVKILEYMSKSSQNSDMFVFA